MLAKDNAWGSFILLNQLRWKNLHRVVIMDFTNPTLKRLGTEIFESAEKKDMATICWNEHPH